MGHGCKGGCQGLRVTSMLKLTALTIVKLKTKVKTKTKRRGKDGEEKKKEG